jgi:hypothetical protein
MQLGRVWLIARSGSLAAERMARRCCDDLAEQGVVVVVAQSGLTSNPFPGLLSTEPALPDLAIVLGAPRSADPQLQRGRPVGVSHPRSCPAAAQR